MEHPSPVHPPPRRRQGTVDGTDPSVRRLLGLPPRRLRPATLTPRILRDTDSSAAADDVHNEDDEGEWTEEDEESSRLLAESQRVVERLERIQRVATEDVTAQLAKIENKVSIRLFTHSTYMTSIVRQTMAFVAYMASEGITSSQVKQRMTRRSLPFFCLSC